VALSPEWQLLLACAKTRPTSVDVDRLHEALTQPQLAWDRLVQRACAHGIAPLVYHTIQQLGLTGRLPPAALETWQRDYHATAVNHTLLSRELYRVLRALQDRGITVIVLKGAALAETVYPSGAVRPRRDTDLLVRSEALSQVESVLGSIGYRFTGWGRSKDWWRAEHYHWAFRKPGAPPFDLPLEVHWHIERPSRPFTIDVEGLWQRAVPATVAGVPTRTLASEDGLLHLCLHACHHAGASMQRGRLNFRLLSCCDIAEVIRHYALGFDWAHLARCARQWGISAYVYVPLQLAKELLGAAVPESVLAALAPEGLDPRLHGWARDELLEDAGMSPVFPDLLQLWRGRWLRDRVAVAGKILSPAAVARAYSIPLASRKRYGYYPLRLKDLLVRYGPLLWRLIRHESVLTAQVHRKTQLSAWLSPFHNTTDEERRVP
jgi:Uncharacterised nucleotidyltransferase